MIVTEFSATMKSCAQCGSESPVAAKFCPECGERFATAMSSQESRIPAASAAGSGVIAPTAVDAKAVFEAFVASLPPQEASAKLTSLIGMNRAQLKAQGVPIPKATNPILVSLMDSLKALPSTEISARIAIVTALGRMADPAVLPPLLLVTGAQSKDVRRATAIALGSIRHPLSAYLLLPMLLDGSSRVKQAAFQGLIQLNQPHTMESILAACPCSKSLRSLVVDTLKLVSDGKRSEFFGRLAESSADQHPNLKVVADWLRFEFRNSITNARPTFPPKSQPPKVQPPSRNTATERVAEQQNSQADESSIFEWSTTRQPKRASARHSAAAAQQSAQAGAAVNSSKAQNSYELSADFGQDDDYSDVRLVVDHNSSAADVEFFNSITQSLDDSHAEQDSESEMEFASSGSQALMSLSGMLAAPEIPMQARAQNARLPHPGQVSPDYRAANHNNFGQAPWSAPQTSTPISAFDTAAMTGNTRGFSNPYLPMMPAGGMLANGMYSSGMPVNMMQPGMMQPGMMPVVPAFDMTASSPLIPAFTNVTTHPATSAAITSSQSSPSSVVSAEQQTPQATAVASVALPAKDEQTADELAAEKARAAAAHQKALTRLSAARAVAIRALVQDADEIPSKLPRLLTKRIATLMSTSTKKMDLIVQQIHDLGTTNSPAALSTLASFSQKPAKAIRQACAEAMGSISHAGSAVLLLKMLADKSGTVVEAAIKSLAKLDLEATRPVLLAAGLCGTSLRTVVNLGVESAADDKKPEWEKLLLQALQGNDEELIAFAVALLARIAGETHLDIFQKLASDKASVLRAAAIEALARTQAKRAISKINDALEDEDAIVRAQAALAVATMHSPRSIELLQKMVFDNNLVVRRNTAQSMSRIDEPALADVVCSALNQETDGTTVEYLLAALQRNGAESSLPILQRYIEGEGSQFREQAIKALRKLKIPASIPVFRRLLDDSAPSIRRHGIEQLTVLKCEGVLPNVREMLKQDPDETVRSASARSLGEFGDETSLPLLEEALEDHSLVRLQAVISLGRMGESSAGPTLLTMLKDQLPEIRYQAVRALAQLKLDGCEESVVPLLQDSDEMVRRGAEQTLQDLGMTVSQIRGRRARKRFVSILSLVAPSTVAGAIPGGAKSLLTVLLVVVFGGGGWGLWNARSLLGAGAALPTTRVVAVAVSASDRQAYVLRKLDIFDVWKIDSHTLETRVKAPPGTYEIIPESGGGVLLLSQNGIVRLSAESDYTFENGTSLEFRQRPTALSFHSKTNSLCVFEGTNLRHVDATTLEDKKKWTLKQPFKGNCIVSPDMKLAVMVAPNGMLTLNDLTTGEIFTANVAQMAGQNSLQQILCVSFTDDMKYICFGTIEEFIAVEVETMTLVKHITGAGGFRTIYPIPETSDVLAVAASRVFKFKNAFQEVTDPELGVLCDLTAVDKNGDLIICASVEERDASVYDIRQQKVTAELVGK